MAPDHFIGVDWGTSRFRATLCDYARGYPDELATRSGPGILAAKGRIEDTLFDTISPWVAEHEAAPLLLAGMVGSNIGWRELPYLKCPLFPADIADQCTAFESRGHDVVMVPGLECVNELGNPDLMRGEELQVLGWLAEDSAHRVGEQLVCLPGTHTKWVHVCDGQIVSFQTAMTGELYSLLAQHSVLLASGDTPADDAEFDADAFAAGVDIAVNTDGALSHILFSARSRMLKELITPEAAVSYLSGLLIGADVAVVIDQGGKTGHDVAIVGELELCRRFSLALRRFGARSTVLDGRQASLNGFARIFEDRCRGRRALAVAQ